MQRKVALLVCDIDGRRENKAKVQRRATEMGSRPDQDMNCLASYGVQTA